MYFKKHQAGNLHPEQKINENIERNKNNNMKKSHIW